MKKKLIVLLVIFLLLLAGWFLLRGDLEDGGDKLTLYGNVDIRQVSLAFDGNGRIVELLAEEGDQVQAGAVMGKLDVQELVLEGQQAQAVVEVQRQRLARLRNGARPQEISQARSRVAATTAKAERARDEVARLNDIWNKTSGRGVSKQELDRATAAFGVATAKVDELRDALQLVELGPRAEDIAGAEAQLKSSEAQLALLEYRISQGVLVAPSDGVVRSRLVEPGDMVTPQRPVFSLALTKPKWVRVYISETDLGRVKPGMAAEVVTDSYPDQPLEGKVGYISSVAEFTPKAVQTEELRTSLVYEVRVVVANDDNQLRLGQPVTVSLVIAETESQ